MLLLTLGASLALLIIAGTTQGCELADHLYTRQWVELQYIFTQSYSQMGLGSALSYIQHWLKVTNTSTSLPLTPHRQHRPTKHTVTVCCPSPSPPPGPCTDSCTTPTSCQGIYNRGCSCCSSASVHHNPLSLYNIITNNNQQINHP